MVTTVSQGLAEQLQHFHPKVYVLPNSIAPVLLQKETPAPKVNSKKFTITYTGSIYHNLQDPWSVYSGIRQFDYQRQTKTTAGAIGICRKGQYDLGSLDPTSGPGSHFRGSWTDLLVSGYPVAAPKSPKPITLLVGTQQLGDSHRQTGRIPGSSHSPVIALIKGTYDEEFETILGSFQAGKVFYTGHSQVEALEKEILQHFQQWLRKGDVRSAISEEKLAKYGWERQFDHLVAFIREEDQALAAEEVLQGTGMQKYSP